ncbi:MAG: cyanophycinase [bacterium]
MRAFLGVVFVASCAIATPLRGQRLPASAAATRVGPARGTVMVVGGGFMAPDLFARFIEAAGGPEALIVVVPNATGDTGITQDAPSARAWRLMGAHSVRVLYTTDRRLADTDSFVAILKTAGGVWFDGGRHYRLVDAYAGTRTEQAFRDVLTRGGVIGGSSAGATILGDFLVRGAPSNDNSIMDYPGYEKGFAYLRGVAIDQHVIARERLRDLADSIIPKFPNLLGLSADEGTAWIVRGDTATIMGLSKAFVYASREANDPGKPFVTLFPGDRFNLAERRVMHRAASDSPVSEAFVDSLVGAYSRTGASVLVARDGKVFIDKSYGIGPQPKYMPTSTVPLFTMGAIADVFTAFCAQLPVPRERCLPAVMNGIGMHKSGQPAVLGNMSSVDELYRWAEMLPVARVVVNPAMTPDEFNRTYDANRGWQADTYRGVARYRAFGLPQGKRGAFVRLPERQATIIVLTNDDSADAAGIAERITDRLLPTKN